METSLQIAIVFALAFLAIRLEQRIASSKAKKPPQKRDVYWICSKNQT